LASPPILSKPTPGETLYLYLSVANEIVSVGLIREDHEGKKPIYIVSKALQGVRLRYQKVLKLAFVLVISSWRLRYYFQSHPIMIRTNTPLKTILFKLDLAGRMMTRAIELSQFDICYEPRTTVKAQVLANFITKMSNSSKDLHSLTWTIHVDGSFNAKGSGAGIVLEFNTGLIL